MQDPASPIQQRLRTVRRRIAAGVLATFVAAWLAVAAAGKGGASGPTPANADSSQAAPGAATQSDDGGAPQGSAESPDASGPDFGDDGFGDDGSNSSQGTQGGPVTSSQS